MLKFTKKLRFLTLAKPNKTVKKVKFLLKYRFQNLKVMFFSIRLFIFMPVKEVK